MPNYNNVTINASDGWVNVNTLSTAPVGTAVIIQNISSGNVILAESAAAPTNNNGPILFSADYDSLAKATIDAGSLAIWAKVTEGMSRAVLAVYN